MDFVYDKVQLAADTSGSSVTTNSESTTASDGSTTSADSPNDIKQPSTIDLAADKLEIGIENAYTKLSNAATGTNWSSLWATVKKQGENAFKETTKDINSFRKEVGSLLSNSNETGEERAVDLSSSQETVVKKSNTATPDGVNAAASTTPSTSTAAPTMLSELTKRAQLYIDTLDRDLEKIENAAGSYVGKIGKDVKTFLKDAVTVDAPNSHSRGGTDSDSESGEDAPAEILFDVPEAVRTQIYSTRLDAQLHALHTSAQPFLTTTSEPDYEEFAKNFNIDSNTKAIAEDLDKYDSLRTLMESLVPEKVPYGEFWGKYYYMRKQIQDQEQRRKLLVQKVSEQAGDEKDISWEDDEEEEEGDNKEKEEEKKNKGNSTSSNNNNNNNNSTLQVSNSTSTRSSTDGSYDLVSTTNSVVDLSTAGKKAAPTATAKSIDEDEDEDDDWE